MLLMDVRFVGKAIKANSLLGCGLTILFPETTMLQYFGFTLRKTSGDLYYSIADEYHCSFAVLSKKYGSA